MGRRSRKIRRGRRNRKIRRGRMSWKMRRERMKRKSYAMHIFVLIASSFKFTLAIVLKTS